MKGTKESRADRSSQRSGGGVSSSSGFKTGALFPRLNVKETKTSGPRAPPRNKMALYEQFTFPSNRFVPPSLPLPATWRPSSSATSTYGPQRTSYEGSTYHCPPPTYTGMPWLPYTAMKSGSQPAVQASVNASSGSTGVDYEGELRPAPSFPARDSACPSSTNGGGQGSAWTSSDSNVRSSSSKKARSNDDCMVPTYSAPQSSNLVPIIPSIDQFTWRPWQQRTGDTSNTNTYQPPSGSDCQTEYGGPVTATRDAGKCSGSGVTRDDGGLNRRMSRKDDAKSQGEEQSEREDSTAVILEKNPPLMHKRQPDQVASHGRTHHRSHERHRQRKAVRSEDASDQADVRSCAVGRDVCVLTEASQGECAPQQRETGLKTRRAFECHQRSEPPVTNMEVDCNDKPAKRLLSTEGEEVARQCNPSECKSSSSAGSDDENDVIASHHKAFELDHTEMWSDGEQSDASMEDSGSSMRKRRVTSRDIIKAIGEQEFWNARQLLQRQQKIFSSQVFELHRLIKVQQLLAISPHPLIAEGIFGDFEKNSDQMAEAEQADGLPCIVPAAEDFEPGDNEPLDTEPSDNEPLDNEPLDSLPQDSEPQDGERQDTEAPANDQEILKCEADKHLDSGCHSATSQRMYVEPAMVDPLAGQCNTAPLVPTTAPGAPAGPWACPPFPKAGLNPWFGGMPTPGGPYMYPQLYPTPFGNPPPHNMASFNGPYGPVMCAPGPMEMPPVTPFGMPSFEQRADAMQNMYRYNPYQQQWQNAVFRPPVPSNPSAGWYGMPPMPYMDPASRGPYGWYNEMVSGAHPAVPHPGAHPAAPHPGAHPAAPHPGAHPAVPHPGAHPAASHPVAGQRSGTQYLPASHPKPFAMPPPWTDVSNGQPAACEPVLFQGQTPRSTQAEPGQISAPSSHRPMETSGGHSFGASPSQQGEVQVVHWQCPEGNGFQGVDHGADEIPDQMPVSAERSEDKTSRRNKGLHSEGMLSWEVNGSRQTEVGSNPSESLSNPLPLFPLVPAVNSLEKSMLSSPFSGVIKAVPRPMVATAESAAEILLSIQKQRKQ